MAQENPDLKWSIFIPEKPELRALQTRKQVKESCDQCGAAKVKCGRERPVCSRCETRGIRCHFSPSQRSKRTKSSATWLRNYNAEGKKPIDYFSIDMDIDSVEFDDANVFFSNMTDLYDLADDDTVDKDGSVFFMSQGSSPCADGFGPSSSSSDRLDFPNISWPLDFRARNNGKPMAPSNLYQPNEPTPIPSSLEGISLLLNSCKSRDTTLPSVESVQRPSLNRSESVFPAGDSSFPVSTGIVSDADDCNLLLLGLLKEISEAMKSESCHMQSLAAATSSATPSNHQPPSSISSINSSITNKLTRVVSCTCNHDRHIQLLLCVAFNRTLDWYENVVPVPKGETFSLSSENGRNLANKVYAMSDGDDMDKERAQLVLGNLHHIARMIKNFTAKYESDDGEISEVTSKLQAMLRRRVMGVTRQIVSAL